MHIKLSYSSGQVLIEVLVAVAISALVLVGIAQVTSRSVANSGFARRQAIATAYADKALGIVKAVKQTNGWDAIPSDVSYGFNGDILTGSTWSQIGTSEYSGMVTITRSIAPVRASIKAYVQWSEGVGATEKIFSAKRETVIYRY